MSGIEAPRGILVKGKYNEAVVFAKALEPGCEDMIRVYLDHPGFAGTKVRVMPDVHLGKGAVIGFTTSCDSRIIPALVGVDIGCGVCACNLGRGKGQFDKLDAFIRKNIPSGMEVRSSLAERWEAMVSWTAKPGEESPSRFKEAVIELCKRQQHSPDRVLASLGTLGGGNHFIEIDRDEDHNRWLLIHSGSRILGARTAEYHEIIALRETGEESPLKYLSGGYAEDYLADMALVQRYARVNRALMAAAIAEGFFKVPLDKGEYVDSVHNYLDFTDKVIRKGAISAHQDERVVIPFSMSQGAVLGRGKGSAEWNYSAPHGAGRKMARGQARKGLSLDEYRKQMRHVWSSCIDKDTLDESPMAYKRPRDILDYIGETVEVERRLVPVYNFKAG
ncbi:MAG: RtcB family protein [Spirochaetales bacterium]|jgi:RNA-splicing ligase RtcB|nr:RtcB family protein [Spirochaetales bacterium]